MSGWDDDWPRFNPLIVGVFAALGIELVIAIALAVVLVLISGALG